MRFPYNLLRTPALQEMVTSQKQQQWQPNGIPLNDVTYITTASNVSETLQPKLQVQARQWIKDLVPDFFQPVIDFFRLDKFRGLPPAIQSPRISTAGTYSFFNDKNTHALIANAAIDHVRTLPPAGSREEALAQIHCALEEVNHQATLQTNDYLTHYPEKTPDTEASIGISSGGRNIIPLYHKMLASLYKGHILFVGAGGAMQLVKVPSPTELKTLFQNDPIAMADFRNKQPLFFQTGYNHFRPKILLTPECLYTFLDELQERKHPDRCNRQGSTDVHGILEKIAFDYPRHIREGRLKVILDKPGKSEDSTTMWESLLRS